MQILRDNIDMQNLVLADLKQPASNGHVQMAEKLLYVESRTCYVLVCYEKEFCSFTLNSFQMLYKIVSYLNLKVVSKTIKP